MNEIAKTMRISVGIEHTKSWMSIPMLNLISIYLFLLPLAQKYLLMHQLCQSHHESYYMMISIAYLCDQYNNVTPRPLECIYSIGYTQHIAFIHPLCTMKPKIIYIYHNSDSRAILY